MPASIARYKRKTGYPSRIVYAVSPAYSAADRAEVGYRKRGCVSAVVGTSSRDAPGEDEYYDQ
jgi:hypothetical protein